MKKKDSKVVPFKNYVLLIVIFIITLGIMTYFCNWYKVYDEFKRQTPVIRGTLFEITSEEELEHYVMENETAVVYLCTASDDNCRNFEKDFIKLIATVSLISFFLSSNKYGVNNERDSTCIANVTLISEYLPHNLHHNNSNKDTKGGYS